MTQQSSGRVWLLQIRPGELRLVREFSEVIRFILERRVDRKALVYEIAGEPRTLGEIPELANLFGDEQLPRPTEERALRPSEEVPYLDSISPLGATESAFADDFYDVPLQSRLPRLLALGLGLVAVAGGGLWAVRHFGGASPESMLASVTESHTTSSPPSVPAAAPAVPPAKPTPAPVAEIPAALPAAAPAPAAAVVAAPAPVPAAPPIAAAAPAVPPASPAPVAASDHGSAPDAAKVAHPTAAHHPVAHVAAKEPPHVAKEPVHVAAKEPPHVAAKEKVAAHDDPLTPHGYDDLVREGDRQMAAGHAKRAGQLFEQAMAENPEGSGALNGMGYAMLDRGDATRAIPLFQHAFWKDAHLSTALFGLGEAYRALGRRKEALDAFRVYLLRFPAGRDAKAARKQIDQLGRELGATASASG
jgi:TolA-binding protein